MAKKTFMAADGSYLVASLMPPVKPLLEFCASCRVHNEV